MVGLLLPVLSSNIHSTSFIGQMLVFLPIEQRILVLFINKCNFESLMNNIQNVRGLSARQAYAVRVASANIVGFGPFSAIVNMSTLEGISY